MNTRKKVIKTVYKDEDESEDAGDFSDSGSDAKISEESSSDEDEELVPSSGDEFTKTKNKGSKAKTPARKPKFAKSFMNKLNKQSSKDDENTDVAPVLFSVKDLTDENKLLPSVLNLSESDSSDDESPKATNKNTSSLSTFSQNQNDSDNETKVEYNDVWSNNIPDNSEEIARKAFLELEKHKSKIEQTKAALHSYTTKLQTEDNFDVNDLLAQGEEATLQQKIPIKKKLKNKRVKDDSDSEMEDWEEVQESKAIPQQGLQLFVELPDAVRRKTKTLDVEMMMKRKMNRVKKEYQVYMHKVHILCWIGHGNYVSKVLNDQELLAASLSLVPGKECYPGERVDLKYVEQITTWFKDKLTLKQDKNENKFRPKAPPLKEILLGQIKNRVITARKYSVFIFVAMLRAIGLQCRIMFNFVTLPIKPPTSELCSLSTKPKDEKEPKQNSRPTSKEGDKKPAKSASKKGASKTTTKSKSESNTKTTSKPNFILKIPQLDGNYDSFDDADNFINMMQVDGSNDVPPQTRRTRARKAENTPATVTEEGVSLPKRARKTPSPKPVKTTTKTAKKDEELSKAKSNTEKEVTKTDTEDAHENIAPAKGRKKTIVKTGKKDEELSKPKSKTEKEVTKTDTEDAQENIAPAKGRKNTIVKTVKKDEELSKPQSITEKEVTKTDTEDAQENIAPAKGRKKTVVKVDVDVHQQTKDASLKAIDDKEVTKQAVSPRKTRSTRKDTTSSDKIPIPKKNLKQAKTEAPKIVVTKPDEKEDSHSSKYFENESTTSSKKMRLSRKRSHTTNPGNNEDVIEKEQKTNKTRTKSAGSGLEKSKYFENSTESPSNLKRSRLSLKNKTEDEQRVSHRDLAKKKPTPKNDITGDLITIIKGRVKEAKEESKKGIVKGKKQDASDGDSDFLPEEELKIKSESDDDFKPCKISPKPSTSKKKIDRRVISPDEDMPTNKVDVWCEVYVEELEQWIAVNVIKGKVHCAENLYSGATHPVCYVVGWDNNNYLKDLTRRYVPHWNTVTRKQRVEPSWWDTAVRPYLGPKTARDREEDDQLDRMQMEAPLPKSITEYKNHPLYALKRHLLKFEAIYPPDAVTLGFVRGEAVYPRACVYTLQSREKWLSRDAKVVKLGEKPYKIVKARPKWDKLSNKIITDSGPLELFGSWQVQDYEPPTAEGGIVPRNAYGNVELFKPTMLPKGTVHIKLPGLNKVAKSLNIDCASAITGFDFNGGWSHPVYDGFVVCQEFEDIITEAWVADQENMERKEQEKTEARVYGNWRRLIKGLLIRERLKDKYGFQEPSTSQDKKKPKGPRLVVTKKK